MLTINESPIDEDKVAGALVGLAVGDALGAPAEFKSRSEVRRAFPHGMQEMRASGPWSAGEYTDDTQMALLLAESLLDKGSFDAGDIARRFRHWSRSAKDVGIQIRRVTAMKDYELNPEGCSTRDFIDNPNGAAGNGAVMRCAPVALFHLGDKPMLYADSRRSALVTHGDPKALTSCVLVNTAIAHFIRNGDRDSPWRHGMENLIPDERAAWSRLESIASASEDSIHSNGYTVSSVEASFWCFARTESFEAAIELAASLGEDADTTAAITGALAGAYYGYQAIPERWRTKLLDCAHIRDIALRLARKGRESEAKNLGQPSEEALDSDRQEPSTPAAGLPMPDSGAAASPSEASFTDVAYLIDEHQRLHFCWDGALTNAAIVGTLESEWGSIAEIAAHRDWPNLMQMVH